MFSQAVVYIPRTLYTCIIYVYKYCTSYSTFTLHRPVQGLFYLIHQIFYPPDFQKVNWGTLMRVALYIVGCYTKSSIVSCVIYQVLYQQSDISSGSIWLKLFSRIVDCLYTLGVKKAVRCWLWLCQILSDFSNFWCEYCCIKLVLLLLLLVKVKSTVLHKRA